MCFLITIVPAILFFPTDYAQNFAFSFTKILLIKNLICLQKGHGKKNKGEKSKIDWSLHKIFSTDCLYSTDDLRQGYGNQIIP